jgi:hypothetical protein
VCLRVGFLRRILPYGIAAPNALADIRYTEGRWTEADSLQAEYQALALRATPGDSLRLGAILVDRAFLAEQQNDYGRAEAMTVKRHLLERVWSRRPPDDQVIEQVR